MNLSGANEKILQLDAEHELRFGVYEPEQEIILQVLEGSAELFGSQLHLNERYKFEYFSSVAVFTSSGCTLKIQTSLWRPKYKISPSKELPVMKDIHEYLELFRVKADTNSTKGPITLITGPTDVGKSTLSRYLLNYAAQHGRQPTFIDLDVGQSTLSITGTFGVLPVYEPSNVNGKFNEQLLSVYYFGYKSPGHNMTLYKRLLEKLGETLKNRLMYESEKSKCSGVIIDTCGWVKGPGYDLILKIVKLLEVDVVVVIGDKPLYGKLLNSVTSKTEVVRISALGGVSHRNQTVRCDNRDSCVYGYFYGSSKPLKPFILEIPFSDLLIYKAKSTSESETHNWRTPDNNSNVTLVSIEPSILYQVLGLSYADEVEDILLSSVYGFICLTGIDMDSKIAKILSPQPGPLPSKYLLMGDIAITPRDIDS